MSKVSRNDIMIQIVLLIGAALLYFGVRGLTETDVGQAIAHGNDLLRFEGTFGLDIEAALQRSVVDNRVLVTIVNWIYIWGHWPVIIGTLVWLQQKRRPEYLKLRNALFVSGAIGLVIFALYPVAPPRLLGGDLVDTVSEYSTSYRVLQPPSLVNKYAALPSLHVGWNLLVGVFVWRNSRTPVIRMFGAVSPALMITAVVLTANHYIVDAVAGASLALFGLWIAGQLGVVVPTLQVEQPELSKCLTPSR